MYFVHFLRFSQYSMLVRKGDSTNMFTTLSIIRCVITPNIFIRFNEFELKKMLTRRFLHLKCNISPLSPPSIVNKHNFLCTLNGDIRTRFCSGHRGEDDDRQKKIIEVELTHYRDQGEKVPALSSIKPKHWTELIKLTTPTGRRKYYRYLYKIEISKEKDRMLKQQKALVHAAFKEQQTNEGSTCPSFAEKSRFFLRISDTTVNKWRKNRLRRAMQFGDKLIFDCSYDQFMTTKEAMSTGRQLLRTFADNRLHKDPFDLHFCNVNFSSVTFKTLTASNPNLRSGTFPLNLHERSYLDLFPKKKLVYLTPDCRNNLTDYDPDSIYIIGAMVDTSNHEKLSMMKAKELGLKMARLPLERYLDWGPGDKTMTLDQMMKIMLAWKTDNSWDSALKHVPERKVLSKVFGTPNKSNKFLNYDADSIRNETLSADEIFERKIGNQLSNKGDERSTISTSEKFKRMSNVDFSQSNNTADKFKKRSSGLSVNIKKLFDK